MNKFLKFTVLSLLCGVLASCSSADSEGQPQSSEVPKTSPSAAVSNSASPAASAGGQSRPAVSASPSASASPANSASPDAAAAEQAPSAANEQTPSAGDTDHSSGGTDAGPGTGGRKTQAKSRLQGARTLEGVIPEDWTELRDADGEPVRVVGDLNKDGVQDAATVIEKAVPGEGEAPERALLIAFGKPDGSYKLSIIADHVLLRADEGGVWGDPFDGLEINRGSLVVSEYGGSNWRWYNRYRFRYQDADWFLIGMTSGTYFNGGEEPEEQATEEDYNLLTGDYIIKGHEENGKAHVEKGNRGKKPLVKLRDFDLSEM